MPYKNRDEYKFVSNRSAKRRCLRLRTNVIIKYNSRCNICGWNNDEKGFEIDHINGGGRQERKLCNNIALYKRILSDETHKYQLLCANCNIIKYISSKQIGMSSSAIKQRHIRKEAMTILGDKCVSCGYTNYHALHIDHKDGHGNIFRQKINQYMMYKIIIKNKNISNYQILCARCNRIKEFIEKNYRANLNGCKRVNRLITINNQTKPISKWCNQFSLPITTVYSRLKYGWSIEDAILKPRGGLTCSAK